MRVDRHARLSAAVILASLLGLSGAAEAQGAHVPVPPLCPSGQNPVSTVFLDDMENTASGNWAITVAVGGVNHWYYPPPPGFIVPASGAMNLWGRDDPNRGDSVIAMTSSFAVPITGARLQFNHAYTFESDGVHHFDGGVVEYSINGGVNWVDAGSLIIAGATYAGMLNSNFSNPLGGRNAFVNDSFGYTASQLNLASLAGQSVRFRFRIGTDETLEDSGWFIDDVRIYQCPGGTTSPHDFNGDGKADILWRSNSGAVATWFMNGTSISSTGSPAGVGTDWTIQGVGDFNGDGKADILWRHSSGSVTIWLMDGTSIASSGSPATVGTEWTIQGVGDFNGDGKADILWRHSSGLVSIWFMNGTSISSSGFPAGVELNWTIQGVGDFNGDGKADILWRHSSGLTSVWLMNGASISSSGFPAGVELNWTIQGVGDFNGDGTGDILWRHSSGAVSIWLMNGTSISSSGMPPGVGLDWTIQDALDFNGDAKVDILWRHSSGLVYIWLMNGMSMSAAGSPSGAGLEWTIQ